MENDLIAYDESKSPISEIFRTLRTNIQFMGGNKGLKTLLITSTIQGEGKTWIASNLATVFAQTGQKVLLIDADMRKSGLHETFNVKQSPGISNYLSQKQGNDQDENINKYLRKTKIQNLYLIPSGEIPPNPSELLQTSQMENLLDKLKKEYDLIIIDGTSSKLVTDSVILSRIVDSTLIVVGHKYPKKEDLQKVIKNIKNVGGNILGIVYNKKPISIKK